MTLDFCKFKRTAVDILNVDVVEWNLNGLERLT